MPSKYYQQYQPRLSIIDLSGSFWVTEGYLSLYCFDKAIVSHRKPTVGAGSELEPQPLHIVLGKLNQLLASFEVLGPSWGRRMHGDISNNENSTPQQRCQKVSKPPMSFGKNNVRLACWKKRGVSIFWRVYYTRIVQTYHSLVLIDELGIGDGLGMIHLGTRCLGPS